MTNQLTPAQLEAIFTAGVIPTLRAQLPPDNGNRVGPPVLVYTAGQPGAGKSRANERAAHERSRLVPIIGDDLRAFHPAYAQLMRENPIEMPEATAAAAGAWIGMSADWLLSQRADVLIETTLRSPAAMSKTIAPFREAGYVVEVRVVAVPHEVSRLSTIARFTGQVERTGAGRWTPSAAHDEAFEKAPETVRSLIAAGAVDRLVIEARDGKTLADVSYFGKDRSELEIAGSEGARLLGYFRSTARIEPAAAAQWLTDARRQAEALVRLDESDADLLRTIKRVLTVDAPLIRRKAEKVRTSTAPEPNTGPRVTDGSSQLSGPLLG